MSATHKAPAKVGVIDLAKVAHMFYEAGWWIAQAQSNQINDTDAFANDWRVMTMHIVCPITGLWHPTIESVESNRSSFKVHHNADVLAADMIKIFLERLHTQGPVAATFYAQAMQNQRQAAQDKLMAMYRQASNHDLELARQADEIKTGLSDTIVVCEIAMTVIGCIITLGAAGPVLVGATAAETGWATFGISSGYAMAAQAVKDKPDRLDAIAAADDKQVDKKGKNLLVGHIKTMASASATKRLAAYTGAVDKSKELSARFVSTRNPLTKLGTAAQKIPASLDVAKTGAGLSAAKALEGGAKLLKGGVSIVFAGLSVQQSIKDWQNRNH